MRLVGGDVLAAALVIPTTICCIYSATFPPDMPLFRSLLWNAQTILTVPFLGRIVKNKSCPVHGTLQDFTG